MTSSNNQRIPAPLNASPRSLRPFTSQELLDVVVAATTAIEQAGYRCIVFGSAAVLFHLDMGLDEQHVKYMNIRKPGDIDLVIYPHPDHEGTTIDAERIKQAVQQIDPRFYRVRSKNPTASYSPFWFSFSSPPNLLGSIKLDLVPWDTPNLRTPPIPESEWYNIFCSCERCEPGGVHRQVQMMPLFTLFVMKLKGWFDHRESANSRFREKVPADVVDIQALLLLVADSDDSLTSESHWWYTEEFIEQARKHAREFLIANPQVSLVDGVLKQWCRMGFIRRKQIPAIRQKAKRALPSA